MEIKRKREQCKSNIQYEEKREECQVKGEMKEHETCLDSAVRMTKKYSLWQQK